MFTLFRKEISGFFSSLTGYVVMIVFLLANSLIMWIMPGQWNLLDSGYAGLDTLFVLSPWLFLFLVPAVTMRLFAEEKRSGTLELLYSRPLGAGDIVYGKLTASIALVLLALLPAVVFVVSVWVLGESPGNLDRGGTAGSFIGLLLLASVYSAIGLFASALTSNQVVSFILASVLSFIMFRGFDSLSLLPGLSSVNEYVTLLGISDHYRSISRGVLDIRDVAYFIAVTIIFSEVTRMVLRRTTPAKPMIVITSVIVVSLLLSQFHLRIDLTEDGRYTLSGPTKEILAALDKDVHVRVYLDGEMPVAFKKLRRTTGEYLDEFRIASHRRLTYDFINPSASSDPESRSRLQNELINSGLMPVNVMASDGEGGRTQKMIFPSFTVTCGKTVLPVNFLRNNPSLPAETNLLNSAEGLEYEIIQAVVTATSDSVARIAFLEGQGEINELGVADVTLELARFFNIDRGSINGKSGVLDNYAAVVIASPTKEFSEADKFVIDQYIMKGGRVMWLADGVTVRADSLVQGTTVALYEPLSFSDMLFRYGARINPVVIEDMECLLIPLKISNPGGENQYVPAPWVYYPLLKPSQLNPITRNLNRVMSEFASTVDTVGRDSRVRKSILLTTSGMSRTVNPPLVITLDEATRTIPEELFTAGELPVAVLLEGTFSSAFMNRMTDSFTGEPGKTIMENSRPTKMIVVADGDIIRNEVSWKGGEPEPLTLGQDRYTNQMFGNKDFIVNCLNYLVNDNGIIELRSREIRPRLLDRERIKSQRILWQIVNTLLPVILIILAGAAYNLFREKHYNSVK